MLKKPLGIIKFKKDSIKTYEGCYNAGLHLIEVQEITSDVELFYALHELGHAQRRSYIIGFYTTRSSLLSMDFWNKEELEACVYAFNCLKVEARFGIVRKIIKSKPASQMTEIVKKALVETFIRERKIKKGDGLYELQKLQ